MATQSTIDPALSVDEVAALLGISRQTATRMFERERGVLILNLSADRKKRGRRTIRIPRAVYERVVRGLAV